MRKIVILLGFISLLSCKHKTSSIVSQIDSISESIPKELIHPKLREGINELATSNFFERFPDIPLVESCLVMSSWVSKKDSLIYFSDSTIFITPYIGKLDGEDYKGIINVDGYNIAIMDFFDFLGNYYNVDSLNLKNPDLFKNYPVKHILTESYYIQNGELKYWNP